MIIDEKKIAKSVINKTCKITGNIESKDALLILGDVQGNINCTDSINCSGNIVGDIQGKELVIYESTIKGNITAEAAVSLNNENSTVIGDIKASNCSSLGKIEGNCSIKEQLSLKKGSSLIGDVNTKNLEMQSGAYLSGQMNIINEDIQ